MPRNAARMQLRATLIVLLASAESAVAQTPYFQGLGYMTPTPTYQYVNGISADGTTAVGFCVTGPPLHGTAFKWTAQSGMTDLHFSEARAVSSDGAVVVGYGLGGNLVAVKWTNGTGPVSLGVLPGGSESEASSISADGQVIGGASTSSDSPTWKLACKWDGGAAEPLGTLIQNPQSDSHSHSISVDGSVIVGSVPGPGQNGDISYWTEEAGLVSLGLDTPDVTAGATGCSSDGAVICGVVLDSQGHALRWTHDTGIIYLGNASSTINRANAISADGEIIGGTYFFGETDDTAGIWDAQRGWRNVFRVLTEEFGITTVSGWRLERVTGVSADGQTFVGHAINPQGKYEGWIAFIPRPAPCPADVDGNRVVDLADLATLLSAYGALPSNSNYSLACDLDRNGLIDLTDLAIVLASYSLQCP